MPVTKSAKRALRVAHRRHEENLETKAMYKKAVKAVRKAVETSASNVSELFSTAQSALDTAAKRKTLHRNKAARLKSRLAKKLNAEGASTAAAAPKAKKAAAPKKAAAKKPAAKKAAAKK
ncbi:MAG TPA: 30S ribosomal protein S20 [Verrucomicrobiae bacterium]|nr:30S ribosomal protein S20 [Verrucomicrobiae bacterium]